MIALEERAPEGEKDIHSLKEYSENLFDLQIIEHPDGIAEARVKEPISVLPLAAAEFCSKGIPVENVIVPV